MELFVSSSLGSSSYSANITIHQSQNRFIWFMVLSN